jgi:hypothetical protein
MKQQLKQQRLRQRQERQRLRAENRKIQTQLSLENEARLRLSKLTALARTLGMTVGMRWQDKSGLAPTRPGTGTGTRPGTAMSRMSRSGGKITLPGEEPAPPAPQAPMAGIPPTWEDLRTTFPLNSSRTVIGGTMDPRRLTQMFAGGKKNRSAGAGGDDGVVDESMIPTLLANASRWGLSNSTTQGTTMYTSVFEALKYQVGGRRKNEVHDVMFVAKDIPVPVWEGTRAQLVIKQDAHDTVHRVVVAQTAVAKAVATRAVVAGWVVAATAVVEKAVAARAVEAGRVVVALVCA